MNSRFIGQLWPPKPTWLREDIPDLSGQVIMITGGNTGIGYETASALLKNNAKVYIAARDECKTRKAIAALKDATSHEASFVQLNLGDLKSIKVAAAKFREIEPRLDVLVNNAGTFLPPKEALTEDGYDLQFGTNALGHYYLTMLLMPLLEAGAASSATRCARVVTVTSGGHVLRPLVLYDTLRAGYVREVLSRFDLYNQSKFANCVFAAELARRYGDKGIVSTACHPGLIKSDVGRHLGWLPQKILAWMSSSPEMGALTQLYAATAPEAANSNGKYFLPWARESGFIPEVNDPEKAQRLWAWFEAQVKEI